MTRNTAYETRDFTAGIVFTSLGLLLFALMTFAAVTIGESAMTGILFMFLPATVCLVIGVVALR